MSYWKRLGIQVYRVGPEKGGKEKILHRNSLKLCRGPLPQPRSAAPLRSDKRHYVLPILYYVAPVDVEEEGTVGQLSRQNLGVPPQRYGL